jgi:hypothetical protein
LDAAIESWVSTTTCARSRSCSSRLVVRRCRQRYITVPNATASTTSLTHASSSSVGRSDRMSAASNAALATYASPAAAMLSISTRECGDGQRPRSAGEATPVTIARRFNGSSRVNTSRLDSFSRRVRCAWCRARSEPCRSHEGGMAISCRTALAHQWTSQGQRPKQSP